VTRLGLETFARLARNEPGVNLCLSPAGLAQTLALGLGATRGSDRAALSRALGVETGDVEAAHAAMAAWRRSLLEPDPSVDLTLACSLWSHIDFDLEPAVVPTLRRWYDAQASRLNFLEPSAIQTINEWVRDATGGALPEVVQSLDPRARLLLISALHVRGRWKQAFHPDLTRDLTFYASGDTRFPHPMMAASGDYLRFQDGGVEGIALPYGEGRWRMLIVLPSRESSLQDLAPLLGQDRWSRWLRRLRKDRGTIILPRFQMGSSTDLTSVLRELGLSIALDPDGAAGSLLQRTRVEVDEQGTRAAAATLMVQVVAWPPPKWQPFHMQVDRPFLFAIEDTYSGDMLFLGAVYDPRGVGGIRESIQGFVPPPGTPPDIARLSSL